MTEEQALQPAFYLLGWVLWKEDLMSSDRMVRAARVATGVAVGVPAGLAVAAAVTGYLWWLSFTDAAESPDIKKAHLAGLGLGMLAGATLGCAISGDMPLSALDIGDALD